MEITIKILLTAFLIPLFLLGETEGDQQTAHLSMPNREIGLERILGMGLVFPHPYFQKPRYRYPVYDRQGRGYLAYGYGGKEVYAYTRFNRHEGHH